MAVSGTDTSFVPFTGSVSVPLNGTKSTPDVAVPLTDLKMNSGLLNSSRASLYLTETRALSWLSRIITCASLASATL